MKKNNDAEPKPEKMDDFFAARLESYDDYMLNVDGLAAAYQRAAALLPANTAALLDLGCGTGLELEPIFARFPSIAVTGIDMTAEMLAVLTEKYQGKNIRLICDDYFKVDLGEKEYDAAISVESLHHFTHAQKRALYERLRSALKPGGTYVELDYVALTQEEEDALYMQRQELLAHTGDLDCMWHIDTPCTAENQLRLLREAGFAQAALVQQWVQTALLVAVAG